MQISAEKKQVNVIVGLGKTGLSCAKYFSRRKEDFIVVDSRTSPPGLKELKRMLPGAKVRLGTFAESELLQAKRIVVSPGVDLRISEIQNAKKNGVPITGDIEIFAKEINAPIIAVTGSNGKSTVVTLLGEMATKAGVSNSVAGNIGRPVLDLLDEETKDLYILELSSFQLETIKNLEAEVATILNVSPDHLDRYDSMREYCLAKNKIYNGCNKIVVNKDDENLNIKKSLKNVWKYTLQEMKENEFGVMSKKEEKYLAFENKELISINSLRIVGTHNILNSLAALAMGYAIGFKISSMVDALHEFKGLKHRCQWVAEKNSVSYYNDSKGTNVGACIAAIEAVQNKIKKGGKLILIVGGESKGADFSKLAITLQGINCLVLIFGKDAELIENSLQNIVNTIRLEDLESSVKKASIASESGDVVLMSPACASFDMYRGFEERGLAFEDAVQKIGEIH